MIAVHWIKVLRDLWSSKVRTLLIVLSIGVGLTALGVIIGARSILLSGMSRSFALINPSSGIIRTSELFDEEFVRSMEGVPGVLQVDARRNMVLRYQRGSGDWGNLRLFAVEDYEKMRVNKVFAVSGAWPPPDRAVLIERSALDVVGLKVGDAVLVRTPEDKLVWLPIAGVVSDMAQLPAQFDGSPYGYVSFETLNWLGQPYGFNELAIIADTHASGEDAQDVLNQVRDKVERTGMTIPITMGAEPGQLPMQDILEALLLVMGLIGAMAIFLSIFLITNTVYALLVQQRRQIGIMKAIGGSISRIARMYLVMVTSYGLCALAISLPLSQVGAEKLSLYLARMFNIDLVDQGVPPQALAIQVIVGITIPILASLVPFITQLRLTVREAISASGLDGGERRPNLVNRMLLGRWIQSGILSPPIMLSLRNTFRSQGRLILTIITLTLAGAIFMSVISVKDSLDTLLEDLMRWWNFEIMITFDRPQYKQSVESLTRQSNDIQAVDFWFQRAARLVRPDGSQSPTNFLFSPRAESQLAQSPRMLAGRWLVPGDEAAVVVDANFIKEEPGMKVGDTVVLKIDGRERQFEIVGVSLGLGVRMIYITYDYLARILVEQGKADAVLIALYNHDPAYVLQRTKELEAQFESAKIHVSDVQVMVTEKAEGEATFGVMISLLLVMSLLLAIVGGLGLMGTMTINVYERTREIGVMRAIGARSSAIMILFISEGCMIGLISLAFGILFALPLSSILGAGVTAPILGVAVDYPFSFTGVWIWLVIVLLLSAVASYFPALNAARLTVREVLAYE
jgi:putative ABC transport system permease protein